MHGSCCYHLFMCPRESIWLSQPQQVNVSEACVAASLFNLQVYTNDEAETFLHISCKH
jgi:hypothetical protein